MVGFFFYTLNNSLDKSLILLKSVLRPLSILKPNLSFPVFCLAKQSGCLLTNLEVTPPGLHADNILASSNCQLF